MMEIDPLPYIFGSFARRRQSQDLSNFKRRSVETNSTTSRAVANNKSLIVPQHDRSKSAPHKVIYENAEARQTNNEMRPNTGKDNLILDLDVSYPEIKYTNLSTKLRNAENDHASEIGHNFVSKETVLNHEDGKSKRPYIDILRTTKICSDICNSTSTLSSSKSTKLKDIVEDNKVDKHEVKTASSTSLLLKTKSVSLDNADAAKDKCPLCLGHFVDPRVLKCLHTFCFKCLQQLEAREEFLWEEDSNDVSGSATSGSGGSGYISDRNASSSDDNDGSWTVCVRRRRRKLITCSVCEAQWELDDPAGVSALPPNYLIQHRMVLNTLNSGATKLLCDLCTSNITATRRCMECALSLCCECSNAHKRQKSTASHEILLLQEARRRGITKVRRQIMCVIHPERELSTYCTTCSQVLCKDCTAAPVHRQHTFELVSKSIRSSTTAVRLSLARGRALLQNTTNVCSQLDLDGQRVRTQCAQVRDEVDVFMERYKLAVERHHQDLLVQVDRAREERLKCIEERTISAQRKERNTRDMVTFTEQLLRDGEDVEVLTFAQTIQDRLEGFSSTEDQRRREQGRRGTEKDLAASDSLQFLPQEKVVSGPAFGGASEDWEICPLYGVVTAQTVAPRNCILHAENLAQLRVGRRAVAILETRDRHNSPLERGGEQIHAGLTLAASTSGTSALGPVPTVHIDDRRDGTYGITFTPDVAGRLVLMVHIRGQPIKDVPVPVAVRALRHHRGTFHCCSFCSSGGSKVASAAGGIVTCGCGGRMPGGYQGCGHGHEGHPGRRHWSCCGNTLEHSECVEVSVAPPPPPSQQPASVTAATAAAATTATTRHNSIKGKLLKAKQQFTL